MSNTHAIRELIEQRADAMRRKDAVAATRLLADDIVAFEMIPPLALPPGAAADQQGLAAWFASWDGPIEIEIRDLSIRAEDSIAFVHSLNRLAGRRIDGSRTEIWMRSTLCFARGDVGWRIVHAHTSVPADPANEFKACLTLQP